MKTELIEVSAIIRDVSKMRHIAKIKGFTLVELMVTVAIIAILSTIAIPSYSYFLTRSKVHQVIIFAAPIKFKTGQAIATNSSYLLADAQSTATSTTAPYIANVVVSGTGIITITTNTNSELPSDARNRTVVFTPSVLYGSNTTGLTNITWTCAPGPGPSPAGMPTQYIRSCQ